MPRSSQRSSQTPAKHRASGQGAVLLLASTRAYHVDDFLAAAERLGVSCVLGTDRCHVLAELWPEGALSLPFHDPDAAAERIVEAARTRPIAGIVPTDERTAVIAARAADRLGLPFNPVDAARIAGNKQRMRERLTAAGLAQPGFVTVDISAAISAAVSASISASVGAPLAAAADSAAAAMARAGVGFPAVLKPLHLSASRGVMRVDDHAVLGLRLARLAALLGDPEVHARDPEAASRVLIESFVPGREVAYEGLLSGGVLRTLAIFDKPDPLDGPFFAETIYVTPSREPAAVQEAIARAVDAAARAIGLREGPVHAELRLGPGAPPRPVVLEVAARSIGGLCGRTLRFGAGIVLEELIIAHALRRDIDRMTDREAMASGVLMLPVPRAGVLRAVHGVDQARGIIGIHDVVITVRPGDVLVPLPEGSAYVGFVFATGQDPASVTAALRQAGACIALDMASRL